MYSKVYLIMLDEVWSCKKRWDIPTLDIFRAFLNIVQKLELEIRFLLQSSLGRRDNSG